MKILFISNDGSGVALAWRMVEEGSDVRLYIKDKENRNLFDGFSPLQKVNSIISNIHWADLVVFDSNHLVEEKRQVSLYNKPVYNVARKRHIELLGKKIRGYELGEVLEEDRNFAKKVFQHFDIGDSSRAVEFKNLKEAITYLETNEGPFVIKPESREDVASSLTFLGERADNKDAIIYLQSLAGMPEARGISKVEMEEKIEGIEVGISAWCNGKEFDNNININFEHKKFATGNKNFPDGLGFLTGEMGTISKYITKENKLYQETLGKMEKFFVDCDFRGQVDINCIVDKHGRIYPLEFTSGRFGYPALWLECELHITPWSTFLYNSASGLESRLEVSPEWCIGIVVVGEAFPSCEEGNKRMFHMPITDWHKHKKHIFFSDVVKNMYGDVLTVGNYVMVITSLGKTIEYAQSNLYNNIMTDIKCPKTYYRVDIGDRVIPQLPILEEMGYL